MDNVSSTDFISELLDIYSSNSFQNGNIKPIQNSSIYKWFINFKKQYYAIVWIFKKKIEQKF